MRNNSKNLITLICRQVVGSRPRSDSSQKIVVKHRLKLLRSSEVLAKLRAKRSDTAYQVTAENDESRAARDCPYSFFVTCNKCGRMHSTGVSVMLREGPDQRQSIAELCDGNPPESLADLATHRVTCPFTGKQFTQTDYDRIFLLPGGVSLETR
jgi:hypothetical protein